MQLVDLDRLEQVLGELEPMREERAVDYAQPHHRQVSVNELGAVTAAAVRQMGENTAAAIVAMGDKGNGLATRCEEIIRDVHAVMAEIKKLAGQVTETCEKKATEIESLAKQVDDMKQTAIAMAEKTGIDVSASSS